MNLCKMADQDERRSESERDELIVLYFGKGLQYKEIVACLLGVHNITLSLRQLKRILQKHGLNRRKQFDSDCVIKSAIQGIQGSQHGMTQQIMRLNMKLSGDGCNLGYKSMHHKLSVIYNVKASREMIRQKLLVLDPEGVSLRRKHRLRRRAYINKGPNYVWHLDGYDKIKPYGFAVHGCIDGFSRKVLWLEVASSNNNPEIVASYYLSYVAKLKGTARRIRGDYGSENSNVVGMQRFFRNGCGDCFAGEKSFLYGKSTSNQRIEAYWSKLRQATTEYWISYFKDMKDNDELIETEPIFTECIRFCFMNVIQRSLNEAKELHNTHRIRPYPNQECPSGKPLLIYELPEAYDAMDYKVSVSEEDIGIARSSSENKKPFSCSDEFLEVARTIMNQNNLSMPRDDIEAKSLYQIMCSVINTNM